MLAATAGQDEEAEWHLRRAIDQNERMGTLPQLARARGDDGMLLRRRGDVDKAAELLGSTHDLARRLGMGDVTSSGAAGERALSPT